MHEITARVVQGHQVASGKSANSPYPAGTISMQQPYFAQLGLDLTDFYPATLNLSLPISGFELSHPDYYFQNVKWAEDFPAEDFSFIACILSVQQRRFPAWLYYPHPETKIQHFQQANIVEIIAPFINGLAYSDQVTLHYSALQIAFYD